MNSAAQIQLYGESVRRVWVTVPARVLGTLERGGRQMRLWRERARQRRQLLQLDDHLLRDIGLSRAEAEAEGRKRFWVD